MTSISRHDFINSLSDNSGYVEIDTMAAQLARALEENGISRKRLEEIAGSDRVIRGHTEFDLLFKNLAEHDVREQAASALAKLRDPRALPYLILRLEHDAHPDVRGAAAQALGELDVQDALDALERATAKEQDVFTVILIERSILRFTERQDALRLASATGGKGAPGRGVTVLARRVSAWDRAASGVVRKASTPRRGGAVPLPRGESPWRRQS
jgi:HEAT repeat protein